MKIIFLQKKLNYTIVSLDNYSSGKKDNEILGVKYIQSDIEDIDSIKTNFDILYRKKSFKQNEIFNNFLKYISSPHKSLNNN